MKLRMGSICAGIALASISHADAVDDHVRRFMTFYMAPGVSVAVMKQGKVVLARGYGKANLETNSKATPNTIYKIASLSKQFVATEVLILEQEGKLKVDDFLSKYIPEIPEAWKSIKLRHLMSHTAGLAREEEGWELFRNNPLEDIIKASFKTKMVGKPGEKYAYSNLGYFLLGHVIEKVAKMNWDEFAAKRIFEPAGLKRTMSASFWPIVQDKAMGYDTDDGTFENALTYYTLRPSGGFSSTALDLAAWSNNLFGSTILSEASKSKMWTPAKLSSGKTIEYGLGWEVTDYKGHLLVSHDGGAQGFNSHMSRYVQDDLTIVVLANYINAPTQELAAKIATNYLKDLAVPNYRTIKDTSPEKTRLLAKFLESRTGEKPDKSVTSQDLINQLDWSLGRLRFSRLGRLRSLTPLVTDDLPKTYTHRYLARFDKITVYALASFQDGKVQLAGLTLP